MSRSGRIRAALLARGIRKLAPLAKEIGVDESAISRWQNGGAISIDHATKLCLHLNISMNWLVLDRGGMNLDAVDGISQFEWEFIEVLRKIPPNSGPYLFNFLKSLNAGHHSALTQTQDSHRRV